MELLKIASSALNIGPHVAMNIAERLYTAGLISYPRTESSAYASSFDFRAVLKEHRSHPVWGDYSSTLLSHGFAEPKVGCIGLHLSLRHLGLWHIHAMVCLGFKNPFQIIPYKLHKEI